MKKYIIFFLIIVFVGCAKTKEQKAIKKVDNNFTIRLEGKVYPSKKEKILATADGFVKKIYVQNGDRVKKGDLIYELDTNLMKMELKKLQKDLETLYIKKENLLNEEKSSMALNLSAIELKKIAFLKSQNNINEFEANKYKKEYIRNLEKLKSDKSSFNAKLELINNAISDNQYKIKTLKYSLKYSKGYASIDGFIVNLNISLNQQLSKNSLVCNILNIDKVIIKAGLASGLLPFVHKNQKVKLSFVTTPPYIVEANITKINPIIDKDFNMMTIDIKVKNYNYILQEGVRVLVNIPIPKKEQKKVKEIFDLKGNLLPIGSNI